MKGETIAAFLVLVFLLSTAFCMGLGSSLTANPSSTSNSNLNRNIIARYGRAYLENVSGLLVLHLEGSPYEMGYQRGVLLKEPFQFVIQNYLYGTIIDHWGYSYEYLINCSEAMEPYIPQEYIEEMQGLADGADLNYTDVLLLQISVDILDYGKEWTGCSGFVVFRNATIDQHLYHSKNVDWSLGGIGLVTAFEPDNGSAFVTTNFLIYIGVGAGGGINKNGVSICTFKGSSNDTTLDGMPKYFMLRKALQYSNSLYEAIDVINQTDRTLGSCMLLGDGSTLNACVIEASDNFCKVFWAGDSAEDISPHYSVEDAVRRTNHFVDPDLAATQRSPYDPRDSWNWSWSRYEKLSELILNNYGQIDAEKSIEFLQTPPISNWSSVYRNVQSVVYDVTDLELWVANANSTTPAYLREYIHLSYDDLFPTPVGGISIPVNKLALLAPYIGLTILLAVAVVTVVFFKHKKDKS